MNLINEMYVVKERVNKGDMKEKGIEEITRISGFPHASILKKRGKEGWEYLAWEKDIDTYIIIRACRGNFSFGKTN